MDSEKKSPFKEAMKGVTPLPKSKKISRQKPPNTKITKQAPSHTQPKTKPPQTPLQNTLSNPWENRADILPESCLIFGKIRLQAAQFKALKQGLTRPERTLDLHGFVLEKARDALFEFIHAAQAKKIRCVLVIHGKGGRFHKPPILKIHVDHWLRQLPEVLAFHSATARDGGNGAVYVLLRKD